MERLDPNLFQNVADAICKAIAEENPEFRGKGLFKATTAALRVLGITWEDLHMQVLRWKDPSAGETPDQDT